MSSYKTVVFANFDYTGFKDYEGGALDLLTNFGVVLNTVPQSQCLLITETPIDSGCYLKISSNGIDTTDTFNIDKNKYTDTHIYFTIRVKTADGFPIKNLPLLSLSNVDITLSNNITSFPCTVTDITSSIDVSGGGFMKGTISTSFTGSDVYITASTTISSFTLSGSSNTFNIHRKEGRYSIRKINEDHNQSKSLFDMTQQEVLKSSLTLYDAFLGQVVSNEVSPETIGVKTFERTANFVPNTVDISYSTKDSLCSMLDSLGATYDKFSIDSPPSLARVIDVFTVPLSLQLGGKNRYASNLDDKGYQNSEFYGINKGDELPVSSTLLYTGVSARDIVVFEKFSRICKKVNTNIQNAYDLTYRDISLSSYELSTYNNSWGWGLILPPGVSGIAVTDYYTFFNYLSTIEGTYLQKFIDFDNPNNTYLVACSSYQDYAIDGGIIDNILVNALYTGSGVISSN